MKFNFYVFASIASLALLLFAVGVFFGKDKEVVELNKVQDSQDIKMVKTVRNSLRKANFAGSFYPENGNELENRLEEFFQKTSVLNKKGKIRMLVVPHAGLNYSGQTAAWGFKQLEGQKYTKVILLGVSHTALFSQVAVYGNGEWETPLGKVGIDEELANLLVNEEKLILNEEKPFDNEHSLEVELIFLQKVLNDFKVVPILVSRVSGEVKDELAWRIASVMDDETLLVVSSDLSHYPKEKVALQVDREVMEGIISGKSEIFENQIEELNRKKYPGVDTVACAQKAISVALKVSEYLGIKDFEKINYSNSGETGGDKNKVVGYGAVGGWRDGKLSVFNEEFEKEALEIAKKTLQSYLYEGKTVEIKPKNTVLERNLGAFVTLKNKGELRGCLGEFEPKKPLWQVIMDRAVAAASKDTRFEAVKKEEFGDIDIEISVMTDRKRIGDWKKIELGKHGVVLRNGGRAGTFLPQVAKETGWSLDQFLEKLCSEKAGLSTSCYIDPLTEIYVFEAHVF
jgi:AmmeMemoRadiSam system protein B/AmmeMemoRadiSam system protein A